MKRQGVGGGWTGIRMEIWMGMGIGMGRAGGGLRREWCWRSGRGWVSLDEVGEISLYFLCWWRCALLERGERWRGGGQDVVLLLAVVIWLATFGGGEFISRVVDLGGLHKPHLLRDSRTDLARTSGLRSSRP